MSAETDPLKKDFRKFLWLIWKYINLPDPTPTQYDIAYFMQHGPRKQMVQAFRGVGKSFICAAYVLWLLYCDPQLKIMVVSASKNRADNFVTFCLQLINLVPELHHLKPRPDQRSSRIEFDVGPATADQTPSVFARGIESQLTGGRADVIVPDDVEIPSNSATAEQRDKLRERIKEFSAILKPLPTSQVKYLGTPQCEDSIYEDLPETFVKRIWPAQVPTEKERPAYGDMLAPKVEKMYRQGLYGAATDPDRFDEFELTDRRAEYGAAGYALQFMLNTSLSDAEKYPLVLRSLVIQSVPGPDETAPREVHWLPNPERHLKDLPTYGMRGDKYFHAAGHGSSFAPWSERVMVIDPSGRGADETAYAVGYELSGRVWVPEAGGLVGGYEDETLEALAAIAARHKVNRVVIESNFGDGMFTKLFEPYLLKVWKCSVEEVHHHTMKEQRIVDTLEPVISTHRLIVDPEVIKRDHESIQKYEANVRMQRSLFYQMTHICREKGALRKDDRIDALAILVACFTEKMAQDSQKQSERQRQEWLEAQLKKQVSLARQGAFGRRKRSASGRRSKKWGCLA